MSPRRGSVYENDPRGAAERLLVLSEDPWNRAMSDSVVVPVFRRPGASASLLSVPFGDDLYADCTKVQSVLQKNIGSLSGVCQPPALEAVGVGVRSFLKIDQLLDRRPSPPATETPEEWWPSQGMVRYVEPPIKGQRKMHAVISDDAWNAHRLTYATVRITSKTKPWRARWEAKVQAGSYAVCADLHAIPADDMDSAEPRGARPALVDPEEMAAVAQSLSASLRL